MLGDMLCCKRKKKRLQKTFCITFLIHLYRVYRTYRHTGVPSISNIHKPLFRQTNPIQRDRQVLLIRLNVYPKPPQSNLDLFSGLFIFRISKTTNLSIY